MSDGRIKAVAAVSMFLVMLLLAYFWPFQIHLDDVRQHLPGFIDPQIQSVLDRLPPDNDKNLLLPVPEVKYECDFYYDPVVSRGEFNATYWILDNTKKGDKFVADIFAGELIMGMTTRVSTTGGDWANAPNPIKMMSDTNQIYVTDNATVAHDLAREENATYLFAPNRYTFSGYGWETGNYDKLNDTNYFQLMYQNPDVSIYKVLP